MAEEKQDDSDVPPQERIPPLDVYTRALCYQATPEEIAQVRRYLLNEQAERRIEQPHGGSHVDKIEKPKGWSRD